MCSDYNIRDFLTENGYGSDVDTATLVLYDRELANPNKTRMVSWKISTALVALKEELTITCSSHECIQLVDQKKFRILATKTEDCEICGGSSNALAIEQMVSMALRKNILKIVVVGGHPRTQEELLKLVDSRIEIRIVNGLRKRHLTKALEDMGWGQVIVIWSGTELYHSVSELYTMHPRTKIIKISRSGIATLAKTIYCNLEKF